MRQESEVADFHEAHRQHVEKEASDELMGIKAHFSDFIVSFPIPIGKGGFTIVNGDDPIV